MSTYAIKIVISVTQQTLLTSAVKRLQPIRLDKR